MAEQIKYDASSSDELVFKYPSDSLSLGDLVVVNPSQEAIFVKGGQALDVFGAGTHTLTTGNLPLLGRLIKWTFGRKTPFTAEVWFVNKTVRRGLKWGTRGAIQMIDPVYKFPVSVRAFGEWGLRISDSQSFVNQIVGSQIGITSSEIEEYFGGEIVQKLSNLVASYIAENNLSVFQINSKLNELSENVAEQISAEFDRFGIEIVNFNIERISIPDEENKKFQEILGKKMEVEQLGGVDVSRSYVAVKTLEALNKAADNADSGIGAFVGAGLGLGAGAPLGKQLAQGVVDDAPTQRLQKLKQLLDAGLITQEEFNAKKQEILSTL